MSPKHVLAVDAGSSGCRALVFHLDGRMASSAYQQWDYDRPAEVSALAREFNTAAFWQIICRLMAKAVRESGADARDVIAVCATSQRQGVVFLDKNGKELYAGPNTDLRALFEGFSIDDQLGDRISRITGHSPSFMFTPAKLKWFKINRPEIYEKIETVLTINNWITYRLCGRLTAEPSSDADTGLVDVCSPCWSQELAEAIDVPLKFCPDLLSAGSCAGKIKPTVADDIGLSPDTLVAVGGGDTQCGLLGMGLLEHGQVGIVAGWSASLQMVLNQPLTDPRRKIWTGCHVLPDRWVLESNAAECGGSYAWLREILFGHLPASDETYSLMDSLAQEVPRGAGGALAFIGPRIMDMQRLKPYSGGFIVPITPSITALEKSHLLRAALENIGYAFKANCSQLEEVSQLNLADVGMGGGLARSKVLVQMVADVLQRPLRCFQNPEVSSYGAAMCAAAAAGVYADLEGACRAMRPKPLIVEPDLSARDEYADHYHRWELLAGKLNE